MTIRSRMLLHSLIKMPYATMWRECERTTCQDQVIYQLTQKGAMSKLALTAHWHYIRSLQVPLTFALSQVVHDPRHICNLGCVLHPKRGHNGEFLVIPI